VKHELTDRQSSITKEQLSQFDSVFKGELQLLMKSCFHAAIARSILASLTGVPWCYDEETIARLIGKSKGTLSHLKTPGKFDDQAPAYTALNALWKSEIKKPGNADLTHSVLQLFRYGCVQSFQRLGIYTFQKLLNGESSPSATSHLLTVLELRWIQEAVFIHGWNPGDKGTVSLESIARRYPDAELPDAEALADIMQRYGSSALLFYHLSSGVKYDDQSN
jgi:hypothetical protein